MPATCPRTRPAAGPRARSAGPRAAGSASARRIRPAVGIRAERSRAGDGWGVAASPRQCGRSEVAPALLLPLDGLEQGLEVALAEAERAVPFDQLEEHGRPVLYGFGEDLQQVSVLVPVD